MLGRRFLMVTHRGRKSGKIRRTVLEVVRYDPETQDSIVPSAYGEHSDWYRNLHVHPALEIRTAATRYVPQQRFLDTEEVHRELVNYQGRHPSALRGIAKLLGFAYNGGEDQLREMAARLRMVAFQPRPQE